MEHRTRRRCEGAAMRHISLELKPGSGLGPFTLGMPICEAIANIEQDTNNYDVVQVKYYDEEPLMFDIVINFPELGFQLRFEPCSQRLRLIDVIDVQSLQMHYGNSLIGGPDTATFVAVYKTCGPTYLGSYDTDRRIYTLFYPGLSFAFPIPPQYECCVDRQAELPLEFPDRTTPVTSRICIYDKSSGSVGVGATLNKAILPPLPVGSLYMEEVHAKLADELWFSVGGQHLPFGASPQPGMYSHNLQWCLLTARLARRSTHFMKIINIEDSWVLLGVFKHQHLFSCKRDLRTPARVAL